MLFYWLQQVTTIPVPKPADAKAVIENAPTHNNFLDTLMLGGWIMVPLALLLLLTLFFFFERLIAMRRASKLDDNFMNIVKDHIVNGNITAARSLTRNTNNPIARMIDKGIQRVGKKIEYIEKAMESVANLELFNLEKNLNILGMIAYLAPMFGFLGTIIGMFELFGDLGRSGEYNISTIANGIYVKMITSATGLIIGMLAYIANRVLANQVERSANKMEIASAEFLDILQEPSK
jgi:biopolymer transport protein ExbB